MTLAAVQVIDTMIVRVHRHDACIARSRRQSIEQVEGRGA